jgi:hypothetical protein
MLELLFVLPTLPFQDCVWLHFVFMASEPRKLAANTFKMCSCLARRSEVALRPALQGHCDEAALSHVCLHLLTLSFKEFGR